MDADFATTFLGKKADSFSALVSSVRPNFDLG